MCASFAVALRCWVNLSSRQSAQCVPCSLCKCTWLVSDRIPSISGAAPVDLRSNRPARFDAECGLLSFHGHSSSSIDYQAQEIQRQRASLPASLRLSDIRRSARSPLVCAFSPTRAHHAHVRISLDRQRVLDKSAASLRGVCADVSSSLWHSSQRSSRSLDRSQRRHCRSVLVAE